MPIEIGKSMVIKEIPPFQWHKIEKVFTETFDSDMPDPKSAKFYGCYEKGQITAFILTEQIVMVGQIYSFSEDNSRHSIKKIVDYIVNTLPDKVVGAVASEKRFEGLFRLLGMTRIDGTFFRRNL